MSWIGSRAPEVAAVWDEIGCKGWAGRRAGRLPLRRTRATPSWTRTHPHFPGPKETRLALQTNRRQICTSKYKVLECSPCYHTLYQNNWEKVVQEAGVCNEISKFSSPELGGRGGGRKGAAWNSRAPPSGSTDALLWQECSVALRKAIEPRSLLRVGRGDHAHRPRVAAAAVVAWGPAWLCLMRHKNSRQGLQAGRTPGPGGGNGGGAGENPTQQTPKTDNPCRTPGPMPGQLGCIFNPTEPPEVGPTRRPSDSLPQALRPQWKVPPSLLRQSLLCSLAGFSSQPFSLLCLANSSPAMFQGYRL